MIVIVEQQYNKRIQMNFKDLKQHIQENYPKGTLDISISKTYQLKLGVEGADILAQSITWPIEKINLSLYFIENQGLQKIIKAGQNWPTLTHLYLMKNNITCEGLKNISNVCWKNLKRINLDKNFIKSKGFEYLVKADWPELEAFSLGHGEIGTEGSMYFTQINWPKLQSLNLNYSLIGVEGMRQFAKCNFPELRHLEMTNNRIFAKGVYYLTLMNLSNLQSLNLNRNFIGRDELTITEIGSVYLSKIKVKNLQSLHIFGNDITLNGIRQILYSGIFVQNAFLQLTKNYFQFSEIEIDLKSCKIFSNVF